MTGGASDSDGVRALDIAVMVESFPVVSQTFVAGEARALAALGHRVWIEAERRADPPAEGAMEEFDACFVEDQTRGREIRDTAWLIARHPLRVARDLIDRRRWQREEEVPTLRTLAHSARRLARRRAHIHSHFARGAALTAMRISRLVGITYSVTGHAFDIYARTTNLTEKLERANFVTSGSDYTVADLRRMVAAEHADRIHKVMMSVDADRFRRTKPYPGGRLVAGVGRLVRKKGFRYLVDASALLRDRFPLDGVVILGDGPLEQKLHARADRLGVAETVQWLGERPHEEVRRLLERADVLAMPCVVLRDGNRDASPTVVKEALAMEVPVVATDEVGLPELVKDEWGRIVPSRDPEALARALEEVLSLSREERVEMGRAGRNWMRELCDPRREALKLTRLIERAIDNSRRSPRRRPPSRRP